MVHGGHVSPARRRVRFDRYPACPAAVAKRCGSDDRAPGVNVGVGFPPLGEAPGVACWGRCAVGVGTAGSDLRAALVPGPGGRRDALARESPDGLGWAVGFPVAVFQGVSGSGGALADCSGDRSTPVFPDAMPGVGGRWPGGRRRVA